VLRRSGSLLFEPSAVSGEAVFNVSGEAARRMAGGETVELALDLFPSLSHDEVADWLHRVLGEGTRERAAQALDRMLPRRLAEAFLRELRVKPDARSMHLELRDRQQLLERMKASRLSVVRTGAWVQAESGTGGIGVREVNPRTMESRVVPGLYFAGGILDVSADWGGFEQHFALASGLLAGRHA
jgi:predicted Rossmann fold flavoprotein